MPSVAAAQVAKRILRMPEHDHTYPVLDHDYFYADDAPCINGPARIGVVLTTPRKSSAATVYNWYSAKYTPEDWARYWDHLFTAREKLEAEGLIVKTWGQWLNKHGPRRPFLIVYAGDDPLAGYPMRATTFAYLQWYYNGAWRFAGGATDINPWQVWRLKLTEAPAK